MVTTPASLTGTRAEKPAADPATTATFADLGVSAEVVDTLARRNIRTPSPIQSLVLADAMAGRDLLAKSHTGSGKTLAFAVPIVERLSPRGRPAALDHARRRSRPRRGPLHRGPRPPRSP